MSKIIYLSDTHLRSTRPVCRTDKQFYTGQMDKLREVLAIAKAAGAPVVHGGDLFHVHNPALSLIRDFMRVKDDGAADVQFHVNPGNHDFYGANTDTLARSGLGVLDASRHVTFLQNYGNTVLCTAPYQVAYPESFYWFQDKQPGVTYVVLLHDMLTTRWVPFEHRDIGKLRTNADIVLCSHWHSQFVEKVGDTWFVNSGPLDVQTVDQRHIRPAVVSVDLANPTQKPELIFLENTGYEQVEVRDEHERDMGLADEFVQELQGAGLASGGDLTAIVTTVAKETGYRADVVDRVLRRLKDAQTCAQNS